MSVSRQNPLTSTFAEDCGTWIDDLSWREVPPKVQEDTRRGVLHSIAGGLGGLAMPETDMAVGLARSEAEAGHSTIYGHGLTAPLATALFANSVMFAALEQQETHVGSSTHPFEVIVPVALALAERLRPTGVQFLEAILAGTEVTTAFATVALESVPAGEVVTSLAPSVYGALGAAAAAAKLLGLDASDTGTALCHAANFASGLIECAWVGKTEYHYSLGNASLGGYRAARLAELGANTTPSTFEGQAGFFRRFVDVGAQELDPFDITARIRARLEKVWGISELIYKRYPVHFMNLPFIDAAKILRERHQIEARDVESVHLTINRWCELCDGANLGPYEGHEGTRGTAFGVASMLARGQFTLDDATEYAAPDIAGILRKMSVSTLTDPGEAGDWTRAKVEVTAGGRRHTYDSTAEEPLDYRLATDEILLIANDALSRVVGSSHAAVIVDALQALDKMADAGDLIPLLIVPAKNGPAR
jgi:2-methylcitrate dehydratase PrpD